MTHQSKPTIGNVEDGLRCGTASAPINLAFGLRGRYPSPMQIIRIPKKPTGVTVARLALSRSSSGQICAVFKAEGPKSAFMEQGEYESSEEAEKAALAYAEQRRAVCLIIEDRT